MILDGNFDHIAVDPGTDLDLAAAGRVLTGIREHVDENLMDRITVRDHEWKNFRQINHDWRLGVVACGSNCTRDQGWQVSRAEIELFVASLHTLEIKKIIDEIGKTPTFIQHRFHVLLSLGF